MEAVCKFGYAELLEDEFEVFQVKFQDQVKFGTTKNQTSVKDLAQNLIGDKLNNIDNIVNKQIVI